MKSLHRQVEDAAQKVRTLASGLRGGAKDPDIVRSRLKLVASDLEDIARKLKQAATAK